jgi:hypothetical protein
MRVFPRLLAAALAVLALPAFAQNHTTTVTLAKVYANGSVVANGTLCAIAVDQYNNPLVFSEAGWGVIQARSPFCGTVQNGALTTGLLLPDANNTNRATPIAYSFSLQLTDGLGNATSAPVQLYSAVAGVSGSTFALDSYVGPVTAVLPASKIIGYGTSVPTSCAPPSVWTVPGNSNLLVCNNGVYTTATTTSFTVGTTSGTIAAGDDPRIVRAYKDQGAFNSLTSYSLDDSVTVGTGPSAIAYVSTVPGLGTNTGNTPSNVSAFWRQLGATGQQGQPGPAASFAIGTVTALSAGATPTVSVSGTAPNYILNLGIPAGPAGTNGAPGTTPTFAIGTVTGLAYGAAATASVGGTAPNYLLNIGIPAGQQGAPGATPVLTVGTVTQLAAGATPTFTLSGTAPNYTINVGIPAGQAGTNGTPGTNGTNGAPGATPVLTVGTVTQLAAGATPTFTITGSAPNYTVNVGIPAGQAGTNGATPVLSVGTVTQLAAGATPTFTITGSAPNYTVNVGIPAGQAGTNGTPGTNGTNGATPVLSVGTVTQLAAGATPTFTITGTAPNYTVNIGIPAGAAGAPGATVAATATSLGAVQLPTGQTSSTLAKVAITGAYGDLSGQPTSLSADATAAANAQTTASSALAAVTNAQTAGTGGVTANYAASKVAGSNPVAYATAAAGSCGDGVADRTAASGATFNFSTGLNPVQVMVDSGGAIAGHLLVGSTITPGMMADSGQTSSIYISQQTAVCGTAQSTVTGSGLVSELPKPRGARGDLIDSMNGTAISKTSVQLQKLDGAGHVIDAVVGKDYGTDYMRERGMSSAPTLPMSEEGIGAVPYTYGAAIGLRYFVDACLGSDSNDGRSEVFPWKSLAHVGVTPAIFGPDTTVLLHDNCVFHDELLLGNNVTATGSTTLTSNPPAFSGTPGHPVVITSYGPQGPALIDGSDAIVATWTAVSGQTTVFQATLPSVGTTNVAYASGTFTVTLAAPRTYIQNSQVSLVNCTNADFDGTGAIITSTTGNIRPSNVFTITGIAAPAESSSLGCGVVFMPRKLYVDQGDAANPEFPLQTQPLTAEHNYAGCWAASTKYNFLDSVSSCAATPVFSLYLEQESGSDASIAAGPTITPFNQAAVSDTNTGVQNVIANSGSWYASGSTIYVHLATGDNPGGHTIEGVQRVFGVALLSVNDVTVDGIAVERTQGPAIASGVFTNSTLAGAYTTGNDITIQNSIVMNYSDSGFPNVWQQGGAGTKLFGAGSAGINGGILIAGYQASCLCAPQIQNPTILNNSVGQFDDPWAFSSFQKVGIGEFGFNNGTISGNFVATTFDTAISSTYANSPGNTGLTMAYNYTTNSNINYSIAATQNAVFHHNRALNSSGEGLQTGGAVISSVTPANGFPSGTEWCDTNILAYDNVMAYLAPSLGNGEGLNGFDTAGGVTGTFANNDFYHVDANAFTLEYNSSTAGCPGTPHGGNQVRFTGNAIDQSGMANGGNVLLRDEDILDGSTFDHNDYLTDTQNTGNAMYVNTGLGATLGANYTIAAFIAAYDTTGISVMPHFRSPSNGDFTPEPGSGLGGRAVAITGVPNATLDIGAVAVPLAQPTVRSHPYPVQHMQTGGACEAGEGYDLGNGQHVSCDNGAFFNWMAYALSHSTGGASGGTSSTPQGTAGQIDVANPASSTPTFSLDANLTLPGTLTVGAGLGVSANPTTNYPSLLTSLCGLYENSSLNSVPDCITMQNVIGTGSTPTWTMTFGHTGSTGAGLFSFGSYALSAGAITGTSLNLPAIGAATSSVNQNSQQMVFNASQWQAGAPVASGAYFQLQPAAGGTNVSVANVLNLIGTGTYAGLSLKVPLLTVSGMITAGGLVTSGQIYDASGGAAFKIIPGSTSASTIYQRAISDAYTAVTFLNAASGSTGAIADFCFIAGSCYMRVGQKGNIAFAEGAAVASATTIAPTGAIFHVTGTTPIATISLPQGMSSTLVGSITIIADAAWTTTTAGNISSAITATAGTAYIFTYDGTNSKWYIK